MGTYEVCVECCFTASHAVRLPDGSLEPPHEHGWNVTATFRSEKLDPVMGVVIDFLAVQEALAAITSELEGKDLNALLADSSASGASAERVAEFLARALMRRLGGGTSLYRLAVSEAPGCWAAWYPQSP
jgi:6-pyruvoyl-tetrahydropterin synthase